MVADKIICKKCGDKIISMHHHDFVYCSCKSVYIDGGRDYTRYGGNAEDLTMVQEEITDEERLAFDKRSTLTATDEAAYIKAVKQLCEWGVGRR